MAKTQFEELPQREGFARVPERRRWHRGNQVRGQCFARMRRFVRAFVGRPWREAETALHRFCATIDEEREVVRDMRERLCQSLLEGRRSIWSGLHTCEGWLLVDPETGNLILEQRHKRIRRYTADDLRQQPQVVRKGKRKP